MAALVAKAFEDSLLVLTNNEKKVAINVLHMLTKERPGKKRMITDITFECLQVYREARHSLFF